MQVIIGRYVSNLAGHYALFRHVFLVFKSGLFPTVVIAYIHFPNDSRDLFTQVPEPAGIVTVQCTFQYGQSENGCTL